MSQPPFSAPAPASSSSRESTASLAARFAPFSRRDFAVLAVLTLAGAALRITLAWDRVRIGDEVGTLLNLRLDAGYLLRHFSGWLTMNYFILAEKAVATITGSEGWPLEVLPMLAAIATIPLTASLARRLGGSRLALTAATLTVFNPYLVRFSPVLRAYAPMAALAVWSVDLFFRWRERRTWATGAAAAAVILALLLMHPNGIYVVIGLGVLVVIDAAGALRAAGGAVARRRYLTELMTFLAPLAGAGLATWLAYYQLAPDVQTFTVKWSAAPPTSLEYVPGVFATYFGGGFLLFIPGGLLLAGIWSATQARRTLLPLCLLIGLSPLLLSLKGVSHFPWAYARFQIYCVPLLLILMAEGICWLATQWSGGSGARTHLMAWALTGVAVLACVPPLGDVFAEKRADAAYAEAVAYLRAQRQPGDRIVIAGAGYLPLLPLLPPGAEGPIRATDFVTRDDAAPASGRIFFVAPAPPLLGQPDARQRFGLLQVVVYAGPDSAARASLRADLARVATGSIDPALFDAYQLLALLDKARPPAPGGRSAGEWRLLALLCQAQTNRFRYLPVQMRGGEAVLSEDGSATSHNGKALHSGD